MSTTFILRATETFALIFTLAVLQFIIFTVIPPVTGGLLIIISWIPYMLLEAYHRKWY